MWEWSCWSPLTASPPTDITALLGCEIEVEQAEERHYDLGDASIDLRRVVTRRQKHAHEWSEGGGRSRGEALMTLRVRRPGPACSARAPALPGRFAHHDHERGPHPDLPLFGGDGSGDPPRL